MRELCALGTVFDCYVNDAREDEREDVSEDVCRGMFDCYHNDTREDGYLIVHCNVDDAQCDDTCFGFYVKFKLLQILKTWSAQQYYSYLEYCFIYSSCLFIPVFTLYYSCFQSEQSGATF